MKKSFWRHFQLPRKRKPKPKAELVMYKPPKKHMTEPDRWKPPFATTKEAPPLKVENQDLIVLNETMGFDLGKVTATVGIMLQARMDYTFQLFVDECLERFKAQDWGGVNEKERRLNDLRVTAQTGTICGIYTELGSGVQIWIATDLDQGITRICLSDER